MNEFELRRQLQSLKVAREPVRDLWPAIAQQTVAAPMMRTARNRPLRWFAAASVLIAMAGMGALVLGSRVEPQAPQAYAGTPWAVRQAQAMDASYRSALESGIGNDQRLALAQSGPPDLTAADRELDAAQAEIRHAIDQDPESRYLLRLLRQTNEQRVRLYRQSLTG